MKTIGLVGRGMVGQVLLERLMSNGDLDQTDSYFFSVSQCGQRPPQAFPNHKPMLNANDIDDLSMMDVIVSTQGSSYTQNIYPQLRQRGWQGYWIDAASYLRQDPQACLVLDPINLNGIKQRIQQGCRTFVGPNCTVSILLLAIAGLLHHHCIESISVMSYQAVSGAGAKAVTDLLDAQKDVLSSLTSHDNPLAMINQIQHQLQSDQLAYNVVPWIDQQSLPGQSREEFKLEQEANLIIDQPITLDGIACRVPTLRSHAMALTLQLKSTPTLSEIEHLLANAHPWVRLIPNTQNDSQYLLTPHAVANQLNIHIGRVRWLNQANHTLTAFCVGDQLLWGAAEPLRRVLRMVLKYLESSIPNTVSIEHKR